MKFFFYNVDKAFNSLNSLGTVPLKELLYNIKVFNSLNIANVDGIVPLNKLL